MVQTGPKLAPQARPEIRPQGGGRGRGGVWEAEDLALVPVLRCRYACTRDEVLYVLVEGSARYPADVNRKTTAEEAGVDGHQLPRSPCIPDARICSVQAQGLALSLPPLIDQRAAPSVQGLAARRLPSDLEDFRGRVYESERPRRGRFSADFNPNLAPRPF